MTDKKGKEYSKLRTLLRLFVTMLKIGLFTFGGGYAMISLLENEFVERKKWLTKEEFWDMPAIIGAVPGSIAVNAATYIGYGLAGVWGSVIATVGVCLPSFVIIYIISLFLEAFLSFTAVQWAFRGIQICVIYLIFSAGIRMFASLKKDAVSIGLFSVTVSVYVVLTLLGIRFSSIFYILIGGVVGIVTYLAAGIRERRKSK